MEEEKNPQVPENPTVEQPEVEKKRIGRPPTWTDPKTLEALIDTYFKNSTKPTLSGLANTIGVDRKTLYNYEQKDEFFPTIKKAKQHIEQIYEEHLLYSKKTNTIGVIFALKNMDWRDRKDTDITTGGKPIPILGNVHTDNSNTETSET
jgi:DNA-binding XRE family transcriptional regulator